MIARITDRIAARPRLGRLRASSTMWSMLALTVVSFLQRPGRTTFDTKLDLTVNPMAFLGRALHLWDPQSTGGQLQNQAYGYLFPMGPYFALCHAIGLPAWISQRLWCALLLCLAFLGALLLARALDVGSEPARCAGALAYALAPRMLTEIGPVSAEMLPAVLLPWIMLPLVRARRIGSPRRAAALSGVAVLFIGGVNAAMVVMVLVLPALWLVTRTWSWWHARLVAWWGVCVLAATLWWILPLLLLGQYSLPFLDYIESASNTTAPMSMFQAMRGTNQWVAYVIQGQPWWPSGFMLVDNPLLMLATGLLAAVGLAGLVRPGLPERRFLTLAVVTGLTLLVVGYVGTMDSPLAGTVRHLLDGPLAPLRNVHKFEPVLRLPLTLAFMHAVTGRLPGLARRRTAVEARRARVAIGFVLVLVVAAPAWLLTLRPGPGWDDVPGYWRAAMTWLGQSGPTGRTLLLPATGFGDYTWGRTVDEPAQALAEAPWAVRSQIPLGSEGNTRVMDAVEEALANGRGSPGLADFLARSGYRYLLLRNDINRQSTGVPALATLRAGLAASPGIGRAATFGPATPPDPAPAAGPAATPVAALEIYEVYRLVPAATAVSTQDTVTVSGGPESVLPLLDAGLLAGDEPTVLAGDTGRPDATRWLVTDGLRLRERNLGRVRDNLSQTLTPDEPRRQSRPSVDLLPFRGVQHQTTAAYRGVRTVTASTSASYADAVSGSEPSRLPFAAVDGDPLTAWQSSSFTGPVGQWLEVDLDTPRPVSEVTLRLADDPRVGWPVTRVRITTDAGSVEHEVAQATDPQVLPVAAGLTTRIRVTVLSVAGDRQTGNVGVAELSVTGVEPHRALRVPRDVDPGPDQSVAFDFTRGSQPRYACMSDVDGQRCAADLARSGEEPDGLDRLFSTRAAITYRLGGTVLPAAGGRNPVTVAGLQVSGSSQLAGDPAAGPLAAVDGDPTTTWIGEPADERPTLHLAWSGQRTITGVRVSAAATSGTVRPSALDITTPAGRRTVDLDTDGRGTFSVTTDRMDIAISGAPRALGGDGIGAARAGYPLGVSELTLSGLDDLQRPLATGTAFTVPCGSGPTVEVDGFRYATTVSGTLADITQHRPLTMGTCRDLAEGLDLPAGEHELRTQPSESFVVQDLWLTPTNGPGSTPQHRDVSVRQHDATHRAFQVGAGPAAVLSVPENANSGWVATLDGHPLERTRVDGWQQAWLVPAGAGGLVHLDFLPDDTYRDRLLVGGVAVLILLVLVAVPVRRRRPDPADPADPANPANPADPADRADRAGGRAWVPVALVAVLAALGGMLLVVLLLAAMLARTLWRPAASVLAFGGMATATGISLAGRLLDHGQGWAYGAAAQVAVLVSVAGVAAARIRWFGRPDPDPGGTGPAADPDDTGEVLDARPA